MKTDSQRLSRRNFLTTTLSAGAAMLLEPTRIRAAANEVDARVAQVMAQTIGIDMHNHVYPPGTEPHFPPGPHHAPQARSAGPQSPPPPQQEQRGAPGLSLAQALKQSKLTAVCAAFVLDFAQNDKPGDARENFFRWLTAVDAQLEMGHLHRALNVQDLQAAHRRGQVTLVQSVEGAQFLEGHLDRVEEGYQRGVRHLQLLHMKDDLVSPLGDVITSKPHLGGLTAFGAEVIHECNRVGMLVDLAHATGETVLGALKVATQPFIVSHTGLDSRPGDDAGMAEMMKVHLISKDRAKVVADAGGVVGVWTKLANSPKAYAENIRAMVDAIGVDHVGIGTDTDLLSSQIGQGTNRAWANLSGGFFPAVVGEMLSLGFKPDEIGKVGGGNYCRVFGKVTGHRA